MKVGESKHLFLSAVVLGFVNLTFCVMCPIPFLAVSSSHGDTDSKNHTFHTLFLSPGKKKKEKMVKMIDK